MNYIEFRRKISIASIISGFISFGVSLLILKFEVDLPFFNLRIYLPDNIEGISNWLYIDIFKNFLVPNFSVFISYFLPIFFINIYLIFKVFKTKDEIHKRGSRLLEYKELKKEIYKYVNKTNDKVRIQLGKQNIPIPFSQEAKNFLFIGMPGSGKTQAIYNLIFGNNEINRISEFNEPMIIYERKGTDFLGSLYRREKDLLFDPRDEDCIKWNIFDELKDINGELDESIVDFFVASICPISDSKSAHFEEQASGVIKALLLAVSGSKNDNNKGLIDFIKSYPNPKDLRTALIENDTVKKYGIDGLVMGALTTNSEGELDNQGNSVFSTCNRVFKNICNRAFYYEESDFCVRDYVKMLENEKIDNRLFIVNTSLSEGSYNTYFSLFFTLLFKHILSMKNSKDRRIHLVLDELMSLASNKNLGKFLISKLIDLLAESRSKGINCILAFQALSQLNEIVGDNLLKSMFQMCGTKVILQYSEPYGSKILSQFLGEKEIERKKVGLNKANNLSADRFNENEEEKIKKIVLESEFTNLEPLEAFIKIGSFPVSKINFEYFEPQNTYDGLSKRELPFFDSCVKAEKNKDNISSFIA